jgi:uncharacterized protein (TIGR02996 family)
MSEALLQAIIDSPDDDSLRLVYADFLDESGEAARATFIRVQIELVHQPQAERRASGGEGAGGTSCQSVERAARPR